MSVVSSGYSGFLHQKTDSSSSHRLDMTLVVAEALNPNKPNLHTYIHAYMYTHTYIHTYIYIQYTYVHTYTYVQHMYIHTEAYTLMPAGNMTLYCIPTPKSKITTTEHPVGPVLAVFGDRGSNLIGSWWDIGPTIMWKHHCYILITVSYLAGTWKLTLLLQDAYHSIRLAWKDVRYCANCFVTNLLQAPFWSSAEYIWYIGACGLKTHILRRQMLLVFGRKTDPANVFDISGPVL